MVTYEKTHDFYYVNVAACFQDKTYVLKFKLNYIEIGISTKTKLYL